MDLVHDAEYLDNRISQSPLPEFRRMCLQCNPCAVKTRLSARNTLTPHAPEPSLQAFQPMSCGRKPRRNLGKEKGCCGSAHLRLLMHISAHSSGLILICQTSVRHKIRCLTGYRIRRPRQTRFVGWLKGPLREAPVAIFPVARAINVRLNRPSY